MTNFAKRAPLRRTARGLDDQTALGLFERTTWGVLSTVGLEGLPYGAPINHVLDQSGAKPCLYFHTPLAGRRITNLRHNPEASFVVVENVGTIPGTFSAAYMSAIAEGPVEFVEDPAAKREVLRLFAARLAPEEAKPGEDYIESRVHEVAILKMNVEFLCGKGRDMRDCSEESQGA